MRARRVKKVLKKMAPAWPVNRLWPPVKRRGLVARDATKEKGQKGRPQAQRNCRAMSAAM